MEKKAILLIGNGSSASDLRYASGFSAPDNFLYMQSGARKICAVSALEYNRAVSSVRKDVEVLRAVKSNVEIVREIAAEWGITALIVPDAFPIGLAEKLKAAGFAIEVASAKLFPEREFKNLAEVENIVISLRAAEAGCRRAIEILKESDIASDRTLVWQNVPLTSEILRAEVDCTMLRRGMTAENTICASSPWK